MRFERLLVPSISRQCPTALVPPLFKLRTLPSSRSKRQTKCADARTATGLRSSSPRRPRRRGCLGCLGWLGAIGLDYPGQEDSHIVPKRS